MRFVLLLVANVMMMVPSVSHAALSPELKECVQRGYEVVSNGEGLGSCVFPDGSVCAVQAFNEGSCGASYKTENYCVAKGVTVWDTERCCAGTEAYLKPYHTGQASCAEISLAEKVYNRIRFNPRLGVYIGGGVVILGAVLLVLKRRGAR